MAAVFCRIFWPLFNGPNRVSASPNDKKRMQQPAPLKGIAPVPFNRCFIAAVQESVTALLSVGGFIVFSLPYPTFCWLSVFYPCWQSCFGHSSLLVGYPTQLALPFLRGLFEMTDGCLSLCATGYPALSLLPLLCALISIGGLCIQAQQALFLFSLRRPVFRIAVLQNSTRRTCLCAMQRLRSCIS